MSATVKGRTLIPTLDDALCQAYPIGEGVNSADSLEVHLPSWVTAATWASCTHCHAVRRTSKYRPAGILTCGNCGQARNHVTEHPALWAERAAWLIKLFRTAGVELLVGELAPMTVGRPGPAAVAVACFEFDEPNPVGPLDGIRVTLHEDLTPWGLPRALRSAWNHLARIESWRGPEWTTGHALEWNLRAFPGDVDAAHRAECQAVAS